MKIEVIQEKFAKALTHINKAVSNKPNIPVLSNVLIETDKDGLKLSSTNLEIGITARLGADIGEEGRLTVSARLLSEFVSSMKAGKIKLLDNGNKLVVNSVDNNAEFMVIPAEDFPTVPSSQGKPMITINALDFGKALDKTIFAASADNTRPTLTGLLMKITKRKLTLVGVDGFRFSQKVIELENGPEEDFKEIIPAKSLSEVNKIIKDISTPKDKIEIYSIPSNNQIIFKIGEIEIASRMIEGEFPPYEDILPKDKLHSFSISKDEIANAIKVVNIFARNAIGNKARFEADTTNSKLKLKAAVVDVGNNESITEITDASGDPIETAYNARYLLDMVNSIEGDEIIYETNGITAPGLFRDKTDDNYIHVIMPMRLE